MDFLNRAYLQLADLYRSMTPGARLSAGLLAVVVLLGIGLLAHPNASPAVDLMHGLPLAASQLPAMEAAFAKTGLKGYEIRGTSIFVPRGRQADYMAALAEANALPPNLGDAQRKAVDGGTMFDLGPQRKQRMQIAKQEELSHGIRKMPGIASASVLCDVDSRPGPFKEKVITASVMVELTETGQLDERLVSAIRTTVAASIAGLKPENVAVADLTTGRTWYGNLENQPNAADAAVEPATATTFPDVRAEAPPLPGFRQQCLDWARQSWRTLAAVVLALVGILALRSMLRPRPAASETVDHPVKVDTVDQTPGSEPAVVPSPHAERFFEPHSSLREELSELVENDPDAAAKVLRSWIGEVK